MPSVLGTDSARMRRAPGPRGAAALASLVVLGTDRLGFLERMAQRYGDFAEFQLGGRTFFFLNHPRLVRHVLVERAAVYRKGIGLREAEPLFGNGLLTAEGDAWGGQRELLQPCFSTNAIEELVAIMTSETAAAIESWSLRKVGPELDIAAETSRLTFRVAGRLFFGMDLDARFESTHSALTRALEATSGLMMGNWDLRAVHHRRMLTVAVDELRNVAADIIERRRSSLQGGDLLGVLLRSMGAGSVESRQVIDQVLTFLVIGHETTACALTWTWYELLKQPELLDQVVEEIVTVLGGEAPTADDIRRLVFTRRVLEETMRLHPPVWLIPREAVDDDEFDGVAVRPGSGVLVSSYTLHRHPGFWREPTTFDPSRFEPRERLARAPLSYLPFGAGQRGCIGGRLAMVEAVAILAVVLQRYRIAPAGGRTPRARPLLTLRLVPGLPVRIEDRVGARNGRPRETVTN